jgi:hypothetical protein
MDVATLGEQLLFTTVYLECNTPDGKTTGTGFVYAVWVEGPKGEKGVAHFLVTNRHVLDKADQVSFQMVRKDEGADRPDLGKAWSANFPGFSEVAWVGHPDSKIDVAVMSLGFIFNAVHQQSGDTPFFRAISPSVAMTDDSSQALDAMEEVVFVGYPRGIFDSVNLLPVARRGTTASHPAVDYEGLPAFLIDAAVFPGSSGSPVLIAQTGSYNDKSGGIVIGNRIVFMGVLAAVHLSPVIGEVREMPTADSVAVSGIPMNLGIVYKAVAVEATIDAWLKANKFRRAPEATSEPGQESEVDQAAATQTQEKVDEAS